MPKKNPDLFELTRGKAGTLIGLLTGLLATLKGLPSTYDKDLQEDKRPVFEATDILMGILPALCGAISSVTVQKERMGKAVDAGMLATDLADYLVRKNIPFREAHTIVGKAVHLAEERKVSLNDLPLADWEALGPFGADIQEVFNATTSINQRNCTGGTGMIALKEQMRQAEFILTEKD